MDTYHLGNELVSLFLGAGFVAVVFLAVLRVLLAFLKR